MRTFACFTAAVPDDPPAKLCVDAHLNAYTPGLQRRQVEGASLDLEGGRVTYVPPTAHADRGWSAAVGTGPGQVARLVHVTGMFQLGRQLLNVDSFAAVSAQGDCLGSFPTGLGQVAPSPLSGWFPPDEVRDVAARAGLPCVEVQLSDLRELETRFPGVQRHAVLLDRTDTAYALIVLITGLGGLAVAAVKLRSGDLALGSLIGGVGVLGALVGGITLLLKHRGRRSARQAVASKIADG